VQTFRVLPRHSFIQSTHTAALSRTRARTHQHTRTHTRVAVRQQQYWARCA